MVHSMIREEITLAIKEALGKKTGAVSHDFSVLAPDNPEHGDYATNVALVYAKLLKKPPMEIAHDIQQFFLQHNGHMFKRIDVAHPGFINIWLADAVLLHEMGLVLQRKAKYGAGTKRAEKISVEYVDANPTGPIHIGHGRSGFLGDALSRTLSFAGYKVWREYYINNARTSAQIQSIGKTALGRGQEYKHDMLMRILKRSEVRRKLKGMHDVREAGFYIASIIQKENAAFLAKKAHIEYDLFFEEEWAYQKKLVEKTLDMLDAKKAIYQKDGAMWFRAKEYGDTEDRVVVRSTGEPTYLLPDVAYHLDRLVRRKFDRVINIFGADHHGYGPRLKGALQVCGIEPARITILISQTVRLIKGGKEFKMSKRKGIFVTLEALIQEVGLDAARFFFLEKSPDTHMDFDLDLAKERSVKNPVYYIQYAHARMEGIFGKLKGAQKKLKSDSVSKNALLRLTAPEEQALIRKIAEFPEIVEDTSRDYYVHRIPRYAYELAHAFHVFYDKHRVITEDEELTQARLALIVAAEITIKNVLTLLGITAPRKM